MFLPIIVPPNIRQALMISCPDDLVLPESKSNPNDPYTHSHLTGINHVPAYIHQVLMITRPDDFVLPESKPNPNDPYTRINNLGNGGSTSWEWRERVE